MTYLSIAALLTVVPTLTLPFTPVGGLLGFSPFFVSFLLAVGRIVMGYIISGENCEELLYERVNVESSIEIGESIAGRL